MNYFTLSVNELEIECKKARKAYDSFCAMGLKLDMSRGKPSTEQLDLSMDLLGISDYKDSNGFDVRNYGLLEGVPEAREWFGEILGTSKEETIVGGNSSLQLMYTSMEIALYKGFADSIKPWKECEKPKFLCPSPGYDRHFRITEVLGFELILVPMTSSGPDMDIVEELVKDDAVKGIWCVPVYSNPDGCVYSDKTIARLAAMKTAAPDFKIFWDNAYIVHTFEESCPQPINILDECKKHNNANRPLLFCSTSKITFAGSGVCAMSASKENISIISKYLFNTTISFDKINQLRHAKFFGKEGSLSLHMKKHAAILAPKFETVFNILDEEFADYVEMANWTKPFGGYFISYFAPNNTAKRIVELCRKAGVVLTGAGAAFPCGIDPNDNHIRIAPSFPPIEELSIATKLLCVSTRLATLEKLMAN